VEIGLAKTGNVDMFDERVVISVTGCFPGCDLFHSLQRARELGFQSVAVMPQGPAKHSLGELPTLNFYEADEAQRERVKKAMSGFKRISIHQAWDNEWRKWIDCAKYLGGEIVTVHYRPRKEDEPWAEFWKTEGQRLREMGDYAQKNGIKIGVENAGGSYEDYVRLVKSLEHPAIGATIDVGHCAYFDEVKSVASIGERAKALKEVICRLVRELGERVLHFHIHNVRRYESVDFTRIPSPYWKPGSLVDHRCVPEGEIDFPRLFSVLKEIGYAGMFELELEEPDREEKALEPARYLTKLISGGD